GPSYEVTDGLRPLETRGVRDRVAVVSNLVIPRSGGAVADAPGGMPLPWHATSMGPLLSGERFRGDDRDRSARPSGQTSDEFVAQAFGTPGLHYRVQAESFRGTPERGVMSWKKAGDDLAPNTPVVSASQAY